MILVTSDCPLTRVLYGTEISRKNLTREKLDYFRNLANEFLGLNDSIYWVVYVSDQTATEPLESGTYATRLEGLSDEEISNKCFQELYEKYNSPQESTLVYFQQPNVFARIAHANSVAMQLKEQAVVENLKKMGL